ncbi:MAG: hypothetical protein GEU73_04635 [Chloroflexi bacterium]|nr:hypothetical protein [Chloroflexota bacterium]
MTETALIAASELGLYVLRSRDGGMSWDEPEEAIPDVELSEVKGAHDGTIYVGTRGRGMLLSGDGLRSWQQIETPPPMQKVRAISVTPDRFLAGTEAGPSPVGVYEWWEKRSWRQLGDLADCSAAREWRYPRSDVGVHVRHLSQDPHVPDHIYAAVQVGGVAISPDGGNGWYDRRNLDLDVHMIEPDPKRPGVVYAGTGGGGLYRSTDYGDSWEFISEGCGTFVVQFAIDPRDSDRLYLGTGRAGANGGRGEVWRSEDGGSRWQKLRGGLPEELGCRIGSMYIDAQSPDDVFFSCDLPRKGPDSGVYHSPDRGVTWRAISDLPQVVALLTVHL